MNRSEAGKLGAEKTRAIHKLKSIERLKQYMNNPSYCKYCNLQLNYKRRHNKFCNQSCAANYNNQCRVVRRPCIQCGKEIKKDSKKYCSVECMKAYHHAESLKAVENGSASLVRIKRYLLETKRSCSVCGLSEWRGNPIALDTHHSDGDSSNNSLKNLVLICPNCHAQTSNYKSKNIGKGRAYRRERYKAGKSY